MTQTIRMINNKKVRVVSNNEAHELIDKGQAELYDPNNPPAEKVRPQYLQRQMKAGQVKTK